MQGTLPLSPCRPPAPCRQGSQGTEGAAADLLPASAGMQQHLKYSVAELALWARLAVGEGLGVGAEGCLGAALAYLAAFEAAQSV